MLYQEKRVSVDGFTLALKVWGDPSSPPVLCLHGKLDNAASFDFLAPLLPHHQLIAIDYPGTGFSSFYPVGVMPNWRNDTLLIAKLAEVCLICAKQGVDYPNKIFENRKNSIKKLSYSEVDGGHHVHMDDPLPVAKIITEYLL